MIETYLTFLEKWGEKKAQEREKRKKELKVFLLTLARKSKEGERLEFNIPRGYLALTPKHLKDSDPSFILTLPDLVITTALSPEGIFGIDVVSTNIIELLEERWLDTLEEYPLYKEGKDEEIKRQIAEQLANACLDLSVIDDRRNLGGIENPLDEGLIFTLIDVNPIDIPAMEPLEMEFGFYYPDDLELTRSLLEEDPDFLQLAFKDFPDGIRKKMLDTNNLRLLTTPLLPRVF